MRSWPCLADLKSCDLDLCGPILVKSFPAFGGVDASFHMIHPINLRSVILSVYWLAFTSYGAFWMSYATILIPNSGIIAAYAGHEDELNQALGIYLITWFVLTFLLL